MSNPQPNALELAKQGNVQAIAFLINRALKPKGITAKVALKNGFLQVMLESTRLPDQATLPSFIHRGVTGLEIISLKKLSVYGRKIGEDRPGWSKEFEFSKQSETFPNTVVNQQDEPKKAQVKAFSSKSIHNKAKQFGLEAAKAFGTIALAFIPVLIGVQWLSNSSFGSLNTLPRQVLPQLSSDVVTKNEYDQISEGISYAQVVSVIGTEGVEQSSNRIEGVPGVMESVSTKMYSWQNSDGSNMNAMFQNDKLIQKAQSGLK